MAAWSLASVPPPPLSDRGGRSLWLCACRDRNRGAAWLLRFERRAPRFSTRRRRGTGIGCELATQEVHFYSFETLSSHMLAPIKHQFWESSTQVCIHIESDGITNQLTYCGQISVSIPWIWSEVNTDQPNLVQWTSPNVFPSLTRL